MKMAANETNRLKVSSDSVDYCGIDTSVEFYNKSDCEKHSSHILELWFYRKFDQRTMNTMDAK